MRKILNHEEITRIENIIFTDKLCLSNIILDAEKLTNDCINNLDIDEVENMLLNEFEAIIITNVYKNPYANKNLISYKIEAVLQFKNDNYKINDWLVLNKKNGIIADAEIMEDNNYYLDVKEGEAC